MFKRGIFQIFNWRNIQYCLLFFREEPKEQKTILPSSAVKKVESVITERKEPEKLVISDAEKKIEKVPDRDLEKGTIEERQEKKEEKVDKIDKVDMIEKIFKPDKSSGSEKDSKKIEVKRMGSRGPRDSIISKNVSDREKLSTK